jgi:hypothetical protein
MCLKVFIRLLGPEMRGRWGGLPEKGARPTAKYRGELTALHQSTGKQVRRGGQGVVRELERTQRDAFLTGKFWRAH